jgi:hypothetical protein
MVALGRTAWRDFIDMAGAVIRAWRAMAVPLVAGGLITIYDRATGVAVDVAVLEVPLLIAFVLAFFVAWQQRQRTLEAVQHDLREAREDSKLPALFGYFKFIAKGKASDNDALLFFAYIEIRNDGFRSVVKDYCPAVTLNGREHFGRLAKTGRKVTMTSPTGEKDIFREKDAIYNVTKTPIEPGDARAGHLHFYFSKAIGDFDKHLIRLYFRDYRNNVFVTEPIGTSGTKSEAALPNVAGMFSLEQFRSGEAKVHEGEDESG